MSIFCLVFHCVLQCFSLCIFVKRCKGTAFLLIIKLLIAKNAKIQTYKSLNIAKIQTFRWRDSAKIQIYKSLNIAKIQTNNGRDRGPDRL